MADYVGIPLIVQMIRDSGAKGLAVLRVGQKRIEGSPIYETQGANADDLANKFSNWASLVLQGNPENTTEYKLWLTSNPNAKTNQEKGATRTNEFNFQLKLPNYGGYSGQPPTPQNIQISAPPQPQTPTGDYIRREDVSVIIKQALAENEMQNMRLELKSMREELTELVDENEDLQDELEKRGAPKDSDKARDVISLFKEVKQLSKPETPQTEKVAEQPQEKPLLKVGKPERATPEYAADQQKKLNAAVAVLWQVDDCIGDDLLILAQIAKEDPDKLEYLLKKLRAEPEAQNVQQA